MRKLSGLLFALLWVGVWAQRVEEVPNPRQIGGWVTDMAGILDTQQLRQLNEMIDELERATGAEMAVVILQRTLDAEPKAFATALFNRWGIGKKSENKGVLVLVALQQRRIEVETGYGIEGILPDSEIGMLLQDIVVPAFRRGDYGGGLIALVRELTQRIRDRSSGSYSPPAAPTTPDALPIGSVLILALAIAGGTGALVWFLMRERTPRCPTCQQPMRLLSERQDNAYLDPLQRLEERLGSVDYRVWRCDHCQMMEIKPRIRWWSGYERCPKCAGYTVRTRSYVVREPTYTRAGLEQIHKKCKNPNCSYEDEQQRVLPRRERSPDFVVFGGGSGARRSSRSGGWSSSGGGWFGGGSFGGGRSGGGGAGASWFASGSDWSSSQSSTSSGSSSSWSGVGSFGGGASGGGGAGASWFASTESGGGFDGGGFDGGGADGGGADGGGGGD
jgi:uncharacterized protein